MNIKFSGRLAKEINTTKSQLDLSGTITFVRHAQSEYNTADFDVRMCNPLKDAPLSDFGIQQALDLREALRHAHFDRVLVSPLTRARQTAKLCLSAHHPTFEVVAACSEWMIAPTDVPSSAEDVAAILAQSHSATAHGVPVSMSGPISNSKERDMIRRFHKNWFKSVGLSEESPQGFAARVDSLRRMLAFDTRGELLIVGHARLFRLLIGGDVFKNCEFRKIRRIDLASM